MVTIYDASVFGWTISAVVFAIIWIAIAFWPARVALRKGHSFILYFIFSIIFFPLALITAYLVHDRAAPRTDPTTANSSSAASTTSCTSTKRHCPTRSFLVDHSLRAPQSLPGRQPDRPLLHR
jgi:hypothetical protein